MTRLLRCRLIALAGITSLLFAAAVPAMAAGSRVLTKSPAKDAAFVAQFEGFKNYRQKSFTKEYATPEGLVIRQSRIENGKIIIPPGGLYYDVRISSSFAHVLAGSKISFLGKTYSLVDTGVRLDVVKDVSIKKGGSVALSDGSKVLELSSISPNANGYDAPKATFQILKPSGNYYGAEFNVGTHPTFKNINEGALKGGTERKAGSYLPGQNNQDWHREYYDSTVAVSGQSYLVADEVTADGAKVKEFATGALNWLLFTEAPPTEMLLGKGSEANLGNYTVKVTEVTANSASMELVSKKDGTVTKKLLGPVTPDLTTYLPADEVSRQKLIMRPAAEDVQVQLDLFRNPFRDGKVALVGYTNLFKLKNPDKWPSDPRFLFRPDT